MQIAKNRAVAIDYELTVDGIVVDASRKNAPLWYLHGHGQLLPKFEGALEGLETGGKTSFTIEAKDGYGEYSQDYVLDVPKSQFAPNTDFSLGSVVTLRSKSGQTAHGRVLSTDKGMVKVDLNHELAGKILNFQVHVADVRAASAAELSHGHIHAPGEHGDHGHHH